MGKPRRILLAAAADTVNPPSVIEDNHVIAQIQKAEGNNLYTVKTPDEETLLVELPTRFRSQIWVKRGSFVVVDTSAFEGRSNKLGGEIANIIRDERQWRKQDYWPREFGKKPSTFEDSEDEESTVGKMPPVEASDGEN